MQFYVNAKTLSNTLTLVGRAISTKPTHPILGCVRLVTKGETGKVCGFDLATAIIKQFTVDSQDDALTDVCVPYQLFSSVIGKLDGDILLTVAEDSTQLTIESETGRYQVACHSSEEYPGLPELEGDAIKLAGDTLREAIATVASSASDDNTKQILCGVNLATDKGTLYFNATNGHTLARYWSEGCQDDISVTIPAHALTAVSKGTEGDIEMLMGDDQVKFVADDLTIISRVLSGAFPAVSQLIPTQFERKVLVDAGKLKSAMSRLAAFADPKKNLVTFTLADGKLVIQSQDSDMGNGKEFIPVDYDGEPFEIGFNFKYVNAGIASVGASEINLSLNDTNQPAVMTGGDNSLFLLMPVTVVK